MSFIVHALASGSSGNATLIRHKSRTGSHAFLIDGGTAARTLVANLAEKGLAPGDLAGIVLTHEHVDHTRGAYALSRKYGTPLIANEATLRRTYTGRTETAHEVLPTGFRWSVGDLAVETFPVPHDAAEPVGVNVIGGGFKMSLVTDLGSVSSDIRRAVRGADLLVCETNHDVYRLTTGPYPDLLKRRILSDHGHLSNEAAVGLMIEHLLDRGPCTIWLAHLSRVNNLPKLALNYIKATLKAETGCPCVVEIALRDKPSAVWSPGRTPVQLKLF